MQIKKVLYIEPGVDEKASSRMLEKSTETMPNPVAFTVVSNAFIGLECTEHTCYDAIIIKSDLPDLQATDMLRILTNVGATTPMILLVDRQPDVGSRQRTENIYRQFFAVLQKPFSTAELCGKIQSAIDNDATLHTELSAGGTIHRELTRQSSSTNGYRNQQTQPPQQQFHTLSSIAGAELVNEELLLTFDTQTSIDAANACDQHNVMLFPPATGSREQKSPGVSSNSSVDNAPRRGGRGRAASSGGRGGRRGNKPTSVFPSGPDMSNSEDESDMAQGNYYGSGSRHKSVGDVRWMAGMAGMAALPIETPRHALAHLDGAEVGAVLNDYAAHINTNQTYQRLAEYIVTTDGAPRYTGRLPSAGTLLDGPRDTQAALTSLRRHAILEEAPSGDQVLQMYMSHQEQVVPRPSAEHSSSSSSQYMQYSQSDINRLMTSPNVFRNDLLSRGSGAYLRDADDALLSSGASSVGVSSTMNTYTHSLSDFTLAVEEAAASNMGGGSAEKSGRKRTMS